MKHFSREKVLHNIAAIWRNPVMLSHILMLHVGMLADLVIDSLQAGKYSPQLI